jgi:holo-[acyl-carrier protein] synthase
MAFRLLGRAREAAPPGDARRRSPLPPLPVSLHHTVGIDLVAIPDVAAALARHGARYEQRLFTEGAIAYCRQGGDVAAERYAARFAAKEAAFKALRLGDEGTDWRDVEVRRHDDGACELALHGRVRAVAEARGVFSLAVSLSHEGGFATAVVSALATA